MFSKRFSLNIRISYHAKARMLERQINEDIILDILETGTKNTKMIRIFGYLNLTLIEMIICSVLRP